jgi:hypothetical protein
VAQAFANATDMVSTPVLRALGQGDLAAQRINKIMCNLRVGLNLSFFISLLCQLAAGQAMSDTKLSLDERVLTASKAVVQSYFFPAKTGPDPSLDAPYKSYLRAVLATDDRHQFDLATMEFVAQLHNGHTFFWDAWFDKNNRQSWASALQLWRCILIPHNVLRPTVSGPRSTLP